MDVSLVVENLHEVAQRIEFAGGRDRVRVVAMTKGYGPDAVAAAVAVGLDDVGENYADELLAKYADSEPARCRWHFLGRLQRNKVARLVDVVDVWHGVDRMEAGSAIARRAPGACVMVQVNLSTDEFRPGTTFERAPALIEGLRTLDLDVVGVTGVGPRGDPGAARPGFRKLAALAGAEGLRECSMGMTGDLEVAVEEGSTMVRIGQGLFGPRPNDNRPLG